MGKRPPYSLLAAITVTRSVPGSAAAMTFPESSGPEVSGVTATVSLPCRESLSPASRPQRRQGVGRGAAGSEETLFGGGADEPRDLVPGLFDRPSRAPAFAM